MRIKLLEKTDELSKIMKKMWTRVMDTCERATPAWVLEDGGLTASLYYSLFLNLAARCAEIAELSVDQALADFKSFLLLEQNKPTEPETPAVILN